MLSLLAHPSFVELRIAESDYQFKFIESFERGSYPDVNLAYQMLRLNPSKVRNNVNVFEDNQLSLIPQNKPFTMSDIKRIQAITKPIFCNLSPEETIMDCVLWSDA